VDSRPIRLNIRTGLGDDQDAKSPFLRVHTLYARRVDMLQANVLVQDRPLDALWTSPISQDVHREEILWVLDRAAEDDHFIAQLTERGEEALQDYDLSWEEKAALLSGDIGWIEAYLGHLDARLRTWLDCRLQQEIW
jgi:hypothetical protein